MPRATLRKAGLTLRILFCLVSIGLLQVPPGEASSPHGVDVEVSKLQFTATEGTWISLDISPDGKTIAFDLLGHLYHMPAAGGKAEALTGGTSWNMFPRFSPDGTRLLYTSDASGSNDLWVLDLATHEKTNVSRMDLPVYQGTWSRDGRHLYGTALNMKVRQPVYQFNFYGDRQELIPADTRAPVIHMLESADGALLYFEHGDGRLYRSGPRIKTYDTKTGKIAVFIDRPGGASTPTLSRDGKRLAFIHKDDTETVLVVHDLDSGTEKTVYRGLDYGRLDSRSFYGAYPNLAWHPDGREVFASFGGAIHAIDVDRGTARTIPFEAPVDRDLQKTMRFKVDVPQDRARTRSHRWGQRTPRGILFEALGELYLADGSQRTNLTRSTDHETDPVYDPVSGKIYFASWNDDELGALYSVQPDGKNRKRLTSVPSQYGGIALAADGKQVAFIRGGGSLRTGTHLEDQTDFELVVLGRDGQERKVTTVEWSPNRYAKRPPTVRFSSDLKWLLFTEFVEDELHLKQIALDGQGEQTLYVFPHATRALLAPGLDWIAFREYHRSYVTPFEFIGKVKRVSAADKLGFTQRVDQDEDGDFMTWSVDGKTLSWTRGKYFYEKSLQAILDSSTVTQKTDLSIEYPLARPQTSIALRNVRVLTMNAGKEVLENTTVLIKENRIAAMGPDVEIPAGAKVYELEGRTIMPGMFDAHGHYGSPVSALNVIEQRLYGLHANLAYGVTTMYDVYGTTQKDFWVSDMLQKGDLVGPRIYSVGDPIFVTKYRTKMHRSILSAEDAEEHVQFNKDHGALAVKDYSDHTRQARQHLAAACRKLGMNLVTESFSDPQMNMTQIIDGFTGIEHTMGLEPLQEDVIRLFAASEIGMTPTLIVVYNGPSGETYFHQRERLWEDKKLLTFFTKDELIRLKRPSFYWPDDHYAARMGRQLKKLYDRGVLLQMGAHGQMMGLGAHWEMELFTHGGFSPYEAIEIATINGFKHHGLDHELGSIETGKLADLVILTENPLEDIRNSRAIEYVMKNGVLYSGQDVGQVYPENRPAKAMYFAN